MTLPQIFQGTYKSGTPSGHGVFVYTNGEKLDGEWNGSAYPDYGIYTYTNGDRHAAVRDRAGALPTPWRVPCCVRTRACRYGGSWKQGRKHGIGTYYFKSGAKYQGEYKEGEPHGNAVFLEKDGKAYEEIWQHGKRVKRTLVTTVTFERSSTAAAPRYRTALKKYWRPEPATARYAPTAG